jgi:hypothetical protein
MGFAEMVVAVVLISSVTSVIKTRLRRNEAIPRGKDARSLQAELSVLREEVASLRRQQADLLLGLDTGLENMERRLAARIQNQGSSQTVYTGRD